MGLAIAGLALAVLAGLAVWIVTGRFWHLLVIASIAVPLMPLLATTLTGDVSRHAPGWMFADTSRGKDEVVIASVAATFFIAILLAALAFGLGRAVWRMVKPSRE